MSLLVLPGTFKIIFFSGPEPASFLLLKKTSYTLSWPSSEGAGPSAVLESPSFVKLVNPDLLGSISR